MTVLTAPMTVLLRTDDRDARFVGDVRHELAGWLEARGVTGDGRDVMVLLASELVTNALQHTMGQVLVEAGETDDTVVVQVHDESPDLPNPLLAKPDELGGRGLAVIAALADEWGAAHTTFDGHPGKVVWAAVRRAW